MLLYELTEEAAEDIQAIARYTVSTWGIEQARYYEALLEKHLRAIDGKKPERVFFSTIGLSCLFLVSSITMCSIKCEKTNVH